MTRLAKAASAHGIGDAARRGQIRVDVKLGLVEHREVAPAEAERPGAAGNGRSQYMAAPAAGNEHALEPSFRFGRLQLDIGWHGLAQANRP